MKRTRLSYDTWTSILSKKISGKNVDTDFFKGYAGLIEMNEVAEPQTWKYYDRDIVVCDTGCTWMTILPQDDFYCITVMLNQENEIVVWYIDMIADQGVDPDGIPYFHDLYLDLVVWADDTVMVDDADELEEALAAGDISEEQFNLAWQTCKKLQGGMLSDLTKFREFTWNCYRQVKADGINQVIGVK